MSPRLHAWSNVPTATLASIGREAMGQEIVGIDCPLPNGCWKCIGCGVILPQARKWNQCDDCDTRTPEDY